MNRSTKDELSAAPATVGFLPCGSGDGYGYGGGAVLTIGDRAIFFGEDGYSAWFANEVAKRWNATLPDTKGE